MSMKKMIISVFALFLTGFTANIVSQDINIGSDERIIEESRSLFYNGDYDAAIKCLNVWKNHYSAEENNVLRMEEVDYMLTVSNAELDLKKAKLSLMGFLEHYPRSIYSNKIVALLGSSCYSLKQYDEAIKWFDICDPDRLNKNDCIRKTLHHAISLIKTGQTSEGYIQLSILGILSKENDADITFYKSYIDYVEGRMNSAEAGFMKTMNDEPYADESKLYLSEIALRDNQLQKAESMSRELLDGNTDESLSTEAERILGESLYLQQKYKEAGEMLTSYVLGENNADRQDVFYLGMSCFHIGEYDRAMEFLSQVTDKQDELAQNAYLHFGLAALKSGDKTKARMAFEQASTIVGDITVREQALYNYALVIHETSYSPFAESVTVFERFLNEFPKSKYSDNINSYLVDVYMSTNSYDAALASIAKINNPGASILEAKQQLLYKKATELFAGAQYNDVPKYLSSVIDLMQYDKKIGMDAYFWRAEAYFRLGEYTKASSDYYRYIALANNQQAKYSGLAKYGLGYVFYQEKDYNKSLNAFKELIDAASSNGLSKDVLADANLRAGDCHFYGRSFAKASEYYNKAINENNEVGDYALYQIGLVDGLTHNYDTKINNLQRLVREYPNSMYVPSALYEEGRAYQQLDKTDEAVKVFKRIISDYKSSDLGRKASAEVALTYYQTENYNEAIKAYKSVIETYPGSDESKMALRDLKSIYVEIGNINEYADYLAGLSGVAPMETNELDSLTYTTAERFFTKGDRKSAKTEFLQYLKQYPNGAFAVNAYYYLGEIYQQDNDYEKALEYYLHASDYEHSRFCEESIGRAADLAYSVGDYETALDTYIRLHDKTVSASGKQKSLIGIVSSAAKIGENDAVLEYADQAIKANPAPEKQIEINYYKAKALIATKKSSEAEKVLKELSKDVRSAYGAESDYLLSQLYFDNGDRAKSESNIMSFIKEGTTHTYWLARSFILLSDIYTAEGKEIEARQYLLSLKQNYSGKDDIANMISTRLKE